MMASDAATLSMSVLVIVLAVVSLILMVVCAYSLLLKHAQHTLDSNQKHFLRYLLPSMENSMLVPDPLIPGDFSARAVQPEIPTNHDGDGGINKPVSNNEDTMMGRIVFLLRYNVKREELFVRLVQIEGLPVSHEIYNPNSAYVDVQLKYTGNQEEEESLIPPRLDIALQQVYYFSIAITQMFTHSLVLRINTFDEEFHRYISGLVEVNLSEEMGDDLLSEGEVVFVKEINIPVWNANPESPELDEMEQIPYDGTVLPISASEVYRSLSNHIYRSSRRNSGTDREYDVSERPGTPDSHLSWELEVEHSISPQSLCTKCENEYFRSNSRKCQRSRSAGNTPSPTRNFLGLGDNLQRNPFQSLMPPSDEKTPVHDATPSSFYEIVPVTPVIHRKTSSISNECPVNDIEPPFIYRNSDLEWLKRLSEKFNRLHVESSDVSKSCPNLNDTVIKSMN